MKLTSTLYFSQVLLLPIVVESLNKNNACKDYKSYLTVHFSPNCYYISDNKKNVSEIIQTHIGVSETHEVVTEDGYILSLFRIPRENPKGTILLQHGLGVDAKYWVAQSNDSIAFFFWRAGYDVWMGNYRGTLYSKRHVSLSPEEEKFWDFSFHEMAIYDLKALINYVRITANVPQIIYIGYSIGGTTSFIYGSLRPEEAASSIKVVINLAPGVYFRHSTAPYTFTILPFIHFVVRNNLHRLLKWYSFGIYDSWYLRLLRTSQGLFPFKGIVPLSLSIMFGWTPLKMDPQYANLAVDQAGSASSLKTYDHLYQGISSGNFEMYDYGKEGNLKLYGTERPPSYPLENIQVPVLIFHGREDTLTDPADIELLYKMLPERAKIYGKVQVEGFNHIDYFFSKERNEKVYKRIDKFLDGIR